MPALYFTILDNVFGDAGWGIRTHANSPTGLISAILPNAYIIAGVILFFYLVFGGFILISSAGNPDNTQKGKQTIFNALLGFLIVFGSYWILQIIQVLTGIPIIGGAPN